MAARETAIPSSLARNGVLPGHNGNELLGMVQVSGSVGG